MRVSRWASLLLAAVLLQGASNRDEWLALVSPVITPAERSAYRTMPEGARGYFREHFWDGKAITAAEYSARVDYIDANFGSGKRGSGSNTDQGRVYLGLGAPNRITNLVSSRSLVPLEIWYYANAPQVGASSELRLLFYRKNSTGIPRLYSPTLDTIRDLLVPQPGTRGLFGPNETADVNRIRERLGTRPVESEVIDAATSVSPGIQGSENDSVLLRAMSPQAVLREEAIRTRVQSRLLARQKNLDVLQTPSPFGGTQVDLRWEGEAARRIRIEVTDPAGLVYGSDLNLSFDRPKPLDYLHRIDLLPGQYSLLVTADETTSAYPLTVDATPAVGALMRGNVSVSRGRPTPMQFSGRQLDLAEDGRNVLLAAPAGSLVSWVVRDGIGAAWKDETRSNGVATIALPMLPSSHTYVLEASVDGQSRSLNIAADSSAAHSNRQLISFNANLSAESRLNLIGTEWMRRQRMNEARNAFTASLQHRAANPEALLGMARLDAAEGRIDEARTQVKQILKQSPKSFEALTTMAFLEAKLQDYPMAATYYRRALELQEAPAIRLALASLPK